MAASTQCGLSLVASFEDKISQENPILSDMANWEPLSQAPVGFAHTGEVKISNIV